MCVVWKHFVNTCNSGDELGEFKKLSERESERVATLEAALAKQMKETSQREAAAAWELEALRLEKEDMQAAAAEATSQRAARLQEALDKKGSSSRTAYRRCVHVVCSRA